MKLIAGTDEAGRGPVLGPLVMSIVAIQAKNKDYLNKAGVKDSKVVAKLKRKKLSRMIQNNFPHHTIKVSPSKIDAALQSEESSLNILEAQTSAKLIEKLHAKLSSKDSLEKVMLDLPTKNKDEYITTVKKFLPKKLQNLNIQAEFKADENYVEVSAASLLAKVARDTAMSAHEKKLSLTLGSGYPADPNTVKALAEHLDLLIEKKIVRTEWKTVKALLEKRNQSSLSDF